MKKTVKINGMTCQSCEILIKEEVEELEGVESCAVSYKKGEAVIEYDESQVELGKIRNVIEEEGFKTE